jgi:hypothetical protein
MLSRQKANLQQFGRIKKTLTGIFKAETITTHGKSAQETDLILPA